MQPFICTKFLGNYLIASRFENKGLAINEEIFSHLSVLIKNNSNINTWGVELFKKMGIVVTPNQKVGEILLIREPSPYNFGRASYEITQNCNYRCQHCYLGDERGKIQLQLPEKKKVIELVHRSGSLWLQLTGGEPFLDKDFCEIYMMAHSLGLLVTVSSNGSLLSDRIRELLNTFPPYRLTLSMYGASSASYEELTQTPNSYRDFSRSLEWLAAQKMRVRLNIIRTKFNNHEITQMQAKARQYGFEYNVFSSIIPTVDGDASPLAVSCPDESCTERQDSLVTYTPCQAGLNSFHIDCFGQVSICKMARQLNCDLSLDHDSIFAQLKGFSAKLLAVPKLCDGCGHRNHCFVCPPVYRLHEKSMNLKAACLREKEKGGDYHGTDAEDH